MSIEGLYDKKVKCIICEYEFTVKKVRKSSVRLQKIDSDFCPHHRGENPLFYDFHICPSCGIVFIDSMNKASSHQMKTLYDTYKNLKNKDNLLGERTLEDALRLAKLSLITANILEASPSIIAGICIRIAWFNRYINNEEEEMRFLTLALNAYERTYTMGNAEIDIEYLVYTIGELSYRLNQYDKSRQWFSILFSMDNNNPIVKKGKRRWEDIKEAVRG